MYSKVHEKRIISQKNPELVIVIKNYIFKFRFKLLRGPI